MIRAATRGIIDYSKYDSTRTWYQREQLLLRELHNELLYINKTHRLEYLGHSLAMAGLSDASKVLDSYNKTITELSKLQLPWIYTHGQIVTEGGKVVSRAFYDESSKLIDKYKALAGQNA